MIKSQVDVQDLSTLHTLMRQASDYWQEVWPLCGCGLTKVGNERKIQAIHLDVTGAVVHGCETELDEHR